MSACNPPGGTILEVLIRRIGVKQSVGPEIVREAAVVHRGTGVISSPKKKKVLTRKTGPSKKGKVQREGGSLNGDSWSVLGGILGAADRVTSGGRAAC